MSGKNSDRGLGIEKLKMEDLTYSAMGVDGILVSNVIEILISKINEIVESLNEEREKVDA